MQTLIDFFGNKNFIPHGYCLSWNSALLWLHVISDLLITLSYYSIPLTLAYFIKQRKDQPYAWLIIMGALFIVACGTTHLMSVILIWLPFYWLDGIVKAFTALISVATALAMLRIIPLILKLPSPAQLQAEIQERMHAQQALEIANTRFSALFNNMHSGVAVYEAIEDGKDFVFRDFNRAGEMLDGVKREAVLNKPVTQIFPDVERFGLLAILRRVWQTGQAEHMPTSLYQDNRLSVYRDNYVYRLPSSEVVAVFDDVTEQKKAEQAQQAAAQRLEKIANQLPSVVFQFVMRTDGSFCVPYASEAVRKIYRVSPEEIRDDASALFSNVHPDDLARHLEGIKASAQQLSTWKDEYRLKFADGTERWLWGNALPQREPDGSTLWHGSVTDITERKQVEEKLRELNRDFVTFLENTSDFIYFKDQNSRIRFCSQTLASITQHENWRDLVGKHDLEIFPKETAQIYYEEELPVFEHGQALINKIDPYFNKDGSKGWVSTCKWPVFDFDNQKVIGIFGISRDITQLKQTEQELLRSNADLEQFAYSVSHDMRQPLRSVSSHLQLLARSLKDKLDEDERINLNFALEGARRMDAMILSLLEYSRVGRKTETKAWMNSRVALDEALEFLSPAIDEAKVEVKITGEWGQVFASHDELTRLFMNLVGNAVKYRDASQSAWVEVDSEVSNKTWKVRVRDYGIGIDPTQIERLFKFFSRLQARTRFEGNGMGLALCRRIVEHHGGQIWVESAGEGQGCCFMFELPIALPQDRELKA